MVLSLVCLALTLFSLSRVDAETCTDVFPSWSVGNGDILMNGEPFHLKGVSWFGFETETYAPHALWSYSIDHFIDKLLEMDINAVRLPFSVWLALNNPSDTNVNCGTNSETVAKFGDQRVCDLDSMDLMEHIVDRLGENGILVMLDQHRLYGDITPLWYDSTFSEDDVLESWDIIMDRFATKWNVFALDLKNEPYDPASWGYGDLDTDWNQAAERIIQYINQGYPEFQGLFFVEGVSESADSPTPNSYAHFWGGNLEGVHLHPISTGNTALDQRVVYSPHAYGPDVYDQDYFKGTDFPGNMPTIWDLHFGFVEGVDPGYAVVVGEWGGTYGSGAGGSRDVQWQDAFADYLIENCMSDNFYWCLNANSGDTGGLLNDDWTTLRDEKVELIARVQPNPSRLTYNGQYCFTPGARANDQCGSTTATTTTTTTTVTSSAEPTTTTGTTTMATSTAEQTTTTTGKTTTMTTPATTTTSTSGGSGYLQVSATVVNTWQSNGRHFTHMKVILTNNHPTKAICGVHIQLVPSSVEIDQSWVLVWEDKINQIFTYPNWLYVGPNGGQYGSAGMIYLGDPDISFEVLGYEFCT